MLCIPYLWTNKARETRKFKIPYKIFFVLPKPNALNIRAFQVPKTKWGMAFIKVIPIRKSVRSMRSPVPPLYGKVNCHVHENDCQILPVLRFVSQIAGNKPGGGILPVVQ